MFSQKNKTQVTQTSTFGRYPSGNVIMKPSRDGNPCKVVKKQNETSLSPSLSWSEDSSMIVHYFVTNIHL